jgi:hypothetical protein
MNQSLKNVGGNTYFIDTPEELEKEIWGDYDRFVYPTIENIKVNLSLNPWITETKFDYRSEWYPVTNFTPVNTNYTHTRSNNIKNMDTEDHRIFLYYLSIGAENATAVNQYYREISSNRIVPIGFVSVEYYSYLVNRRQYYTAILLVDSQIKLLEAFLKEGPDNEISGDIETLNKNKALLMEQARSLQYIR